MTVNHGVPGSSPGEGAKPPQSGGFFCGLNFGGREIHLFLVNPPANNLQIFTCESYNPCSNDYHKLND